MAGTIKNKDDIEKSVARLRHAADMLQAVLDGESTLQAAADKISLTPQEMNRNLRKEFAPYIRAAMPSTDAMCEMLDLCKTPGDRFLLAILGEDEFDLKPRPKDTLVLPPEYDEEILWDTAHAVLTSREYRIISELYAKGPDDQNKVREVAQALCVTRERVYQLRRKAIRKMRRPAVLNRLFPTMTAWATDVTGILEHNVRTELAKCAAAMDESAAGRAIAALAGHYAETGGLGPETISEFMSAIGWKAEPKRGPVAISSIDMSVRTFHALHRAGIDTLDQVAEMPIGDIKAIRNLGRLSRGELGALLLRHLGIYRHDLMEELEASNAKKPGTEEGNCG